MIRLPNYFGLVQETTKHLLKEKYLWKKIKKNKFGGVILFQGTKESATSLVKEIKSAIDFPIIFSMDAEWGPAMRIKGAPKLPYAITLGATKGKFLTLECGKIMADLLKELGVGISFSPVADVNTNPNNPIISFRSFSDNPEKAQKKALALMEGLQRENVLACAKHFPGHGDTDVDSHLSLPIITKPKEEVLKEDVFPFKELIASGVGAVMVAHISVPSFDESGVPSSISSTIISNYLQDSLLFKGLVISDAMNMKGVTALFETSIEADIAAFLAGNDIILYSSSPEKSIAEIAKRIESGEIKSTFLDKKVKKALLLREWVEKGLSETPKLLLIIKRFRK